MGLGEALVEQARVGLLEALLLAAGEVREQPRLLDTSGYRPWAPGLSAGTHGLVAQQ